MQPQMNLTPRPRRHGIALLSIILAWGCHSPSFSQSSDKNQRREPPAATTSKVVLHVSLIGDAGYAGPANDAPIRAIGRAAREITAPELTVYLGDNIYGEGMPPEGDPDRARSEGVIDTQLKIFEEDSSMAGFFIPGNHDWSGMDEDGRASIVRQGDYIRAATNGRIRLVPDSAQPGPVLVMRNDVLQVIALDSQWWLHAFDKPYYPGVASDSAMQAAIADSLHILLSEYDGKVSLVLAHHPLETHGPHGGYFPVTDHIFPLRNVVSWLYLPLPVIGSAYPVARASGYSEQDITSETYQLYVRSIGRVVSIATARGRGPVFVASGHEHDLQVLQPREDLWYLVSGNGILDHASDLSDGPNTRFASETAGYMTLDIHEDGGTMLKVIGIEGPESDPVVLFEQWIAPKGK